MTKTFMAIGLGLLAVILGPANAVLAQMESSSTIITKEEGGAGEAWSLRVSVVKDHSVAVCSGRFVLSLAFPEDPNKQTMRHLVDVSADEPPFSLQYNFDPPSSSVRDLVEVHRGAFEVAYAGSGGCSIVLSTSKFVASTGESIGIHAGGTMFFGCDCFDDSDILHGRL